MVFAEWKVPTISTKPKEPGPQTVGFWVGLGGIVLSTGDVPALLQAGTAAGITDGKEPVTYWAWTEWVPKGGGGAGPKTVYTKVGKKKKKFEVKPGDVMSVLVCAPESKHGYVNMWNHRTNEIVSIGVSTGKIDGSTVDWIVEAPYTEVPNFGSVKFTKISAGTKHHVIHLSSATVTNIYNAPADTKVLASGSILSKKNEVKVTWNAAQ
jgi:hypothetical protein